MFEWRSTTCFIYRVRYCLLCKTLGLHEMGTWFHELKHSMPGVELLATAAHSVKRSHIALAVYNDMHDVAWLCHPIMCCRSACSDNALTCAPQRKH